MPTILSRCLSTLQENVVRNLPVSSSGCPVSWSDCELRFSGIEVHFQLLIRFRLSVLVALCWSRKSKSFMLGYSLGLSSLLLKFRLSLSMCIHFSRGMLLYPSALAAIETSSERERHCSRCCNIAPRTPHYRHPSRTGLSPLLH